VKFLLDHDVPNDLAFSLGPLDHPVVKVREIMPATDDEVLHFARAQERVLITCNRDDFIAAAKRVAHWGIIILIRRHSRALERAALIRLLDRAGETGIVNNINFA
jgi:predicted nuclease of predicted toxin-antitoxin system